MKIKEFIQNVAAETRHYIEKFEQYKDLSGEQKKARVDDIILTYCQNTIDSLSLNFVFKWIFKTIVIPNIPYLTQAIFDLIASKVQGITK